MASTLNLYAELYCRHAGRGELANTTPDSNLLRFDIWLIYRCVI